LTLYPGIPPIVPSTNDLLYVFPGDRIDGWGLPGHGEAKWDCGHFFTIGCLETADHTQTRLDGVDVTGKIFIKRNVIKCGRPSCPICYESWASREAHRIDRRFKKYHTRMKAIHVVVSPSQVDWALSVTSMRKKVYKLVKRVGFFGGCCIFHPFRQDEYTERWYFSPHFHLIGFGWIEGTGDEYRSSGWIVKNVGVRISVQATAFYQLSHCGIFYGQGRKHSVTWFGSMSYNKLKIPEEIPKDDLCPLCGRKLSNIVYIGSNPCPIGDVITETWIDPGGWIYEKAGDF